VKNAASEARKLSAGASYLGAETFSEICLAAAYAAESGNARDFLGLFEEIQEQWPELRMELLDLEKQFAG
jgi:hypothetical protein